MAYVKYGVLIYIPSPSSPFHIYVAYGLPLALGVKQGEKVSQIFLQQTNACKTYTKVIFKMRETKKISNGFAKIMRPKFSSNRPLSVLFHVSLKTGAFQSAYVSTLKF